MTPEMPHIARDGTTRARPRAATPLWKRLWPKARPMLLDADPTALRIEAAMIDQDGPRQAAGIREQVIDVIWGRRSLDGRLLSEKDQRSAAWRLNLMMFPPNPPLALLILLINAIGGMRPKLVRIGMMITLVMWMFILSGVERMMMNMRAQGMTTDHAVLVGQ